MDAFICDATRTPIGRFGGALAFMRPDNMAAHVIQALLVRNPSLDPLAIDEVVFGCANQAGEDNRNVARMATLLAGLPTDVRRAPLIGYVRLVWMRSRWQDEVSTLVIFVLSSPAA